MMGLYRLENFKLNGTLMNFNEAKDVADALKGKVTKSKLRAMTKKQLLDHAENDLGTKLDSSLTKSNIINKVYLIHQSK